MMTILEMWGTASILLVAAWLVWESTLEVDRRRSTKYKLGNEDEK